MKTATIPECFFTQESEYYRPTAHTRGPWNENACHAGPPSGLLARAMEAALPEKQLCRITVELLRPIPFTGFRVEADITRNGKTVSTTKASLIDDDGKTIISATGLHMAPQSKNELPSHTATIGKPANAKNGLFPIVDTLHGLPAFNGTGVQTRYPSGHDNTPGPTTAWLKTVPLLASESPSAFQRICPLADCGNAFGRNAEPHQVAFMNTDLTLLLHRPPQGEWLGTQSVGYWEPNGIGMADALLFDEHGVVGRALQTLLLRVN